MMKSLYYWLRWNFLRIFFPKKFLAMQKQLGEIIDEVLRTRNTEWKVQP